MERKPLKSLIRGALEVSGCLVEDGKDYLEVLVPQEIAARIGMGEHQLLYFGPQKEGDGEFISYSSEILDNISQLIQDKGLFCKTNLPHLYLKREGLGEAISRKLSFLNSTYRLKQVGQRLVSYLVFHFKYSAISEEKKEGIVPVVINEMTLASPKEMTNALKSYYEESLEEREAKGGRPLEEIYSAACKIAAREIRQDAADFERGLNRRLNKDVARLKEYYGALKEEVQEVIRKRELLGEEKERELSKLKAIDMELNRKIKDQQDRYSLKVNVSLVNAMRIMMPASVITLRVKRKDKEKDLLLTWNPLLKELESPVCERCFDTLKELYLCDEKLHCLCPQCHDCPSCYKAVCRVCHPQTCPKCGAAF